MLGVGAGFSVFRLSLQRNKNREENENRSEPDFCQKSEMYPYIVGLLVPFFGPALG